MKLTLSKPVRQAIISGNATNHHSCQVKAHPIQSSGLYQIQVSAPKMNLTIDIELRGCEATLLNTSANFSHNHRTTDFSQAELAALDPDCTLIQTIHHALNDLA